MTVTRSEPRHRNLTAIIVDMAGLMTNILGPHLIADTG